MLLQFWVPLKFTRFFIKTSNKSPHGRNSTIINSLPVRKQGIIPSHKNSLRDWKITGDHHCGGENVFRVHLLPFYTPPQWYVHHALKGSLRIKKIDEGFFFFFFFFTPLYIVWRKQQEKIIFFFRVKFLRGKLLVRLVRQTFHHLPPNLITFPRLISPIRYPSNYFLFVIPFLVQHPSKRTTFTWGFNFFISFNSSVKSERSFESAVSKNK